MHLTKEDIIAGYQSILGRKPESEAIINEKLAHTDTIWGLVDELINSPEARRRFETTDPNGVYSGINDGDLELLARHLIISEPTSGCMTDFVGAKTDISYNNHMSGLDGFVEGLPVPSSFHAEAIEWIGTLKAVEQAEGEFTVAEIGAGWGPWLVSSSVAATRHGIPDIHMVGIEADEGHYKSLLKHVESNGFDPNAHKFILGIVGPQDGFAFFPKIDSEEDWGAAAVFSKTGEPPKKDYRGHVLEFTKFKSYTVASVLSVHDRFDLVHIDIQGAEREVIPAAIPVLNEKVEWMVLGTHSRSIEGQMMDLLSGEKWQLTNEKPCRFDISASQELITESATLVDGTQVWRNRRFGSVE